MSNTSYIDRKIKNLSLEINSIMDSFESQKIKNNNFSKEYYNRNIPIALDESENVSFELKNFADKVSEYHSKSISSNEKESLLSELENLKDSIVNKFDIFKNASDSYVNSINKFENNNISKQGGGDMGNSIRLIDSRGNIVNSLGKDEKFADRYKSMNKNIYSSSSNAGSKLDLGKYIKGSITGEWENAQNELNAFRELSTSTGKTLIPKELSAEILDLARNRIVLEDVQIIPMDSNNLTLAKIENDPSFVFKEELAKSNISDMTFGAVEFKSRTVYGLMKLSLELLHSAKNITQVIEHAISMSVASIIDEKCLYGNGEIEPRGILTLDSINKVDVEPVEVSRYKGFIKGLGAVRRANGEPTSVAYNAVIDEEVNLLVDNMGLPLDKPNSISNFNYVISNQIKDNHAMVYDSRALALGIQNSVSIEIDEAGLGFEDGSVYIRVYAMLDIQPLYPKHISLINFQEQQKKARLEK